MLFENYFENPDILHIGTEAPRAYFIPVSQGTVPPHTERRGESDRFFLLSGQWDFKYYENVRTLEEPFWEEGFKRAGFAPLPVPSVWQNHGFDGHQYTNVRYPFPCDPPYVPIENPCGGYLKDFDWKKEDGFKYYLNFEGVDSAFYLWVNGTFAGYSQVPHSTSEFDITPLLRDGKNTLAVLVLKWSDGSYLEDQDKLRTSGIFRDVYLLTRPENHIRDYFVHTKILDGGKKAVISADIAFSASAAAVSYTLDAPCGCRIAGGEAADGKIAVEVEAPVLWNAESPALYTLTLTCAGETIAQKVGIREIEVKDGIVYLNGRKIKFRGVNRHDSDPVVGPAVTLSMMKKDLRLMKEHNVNAIRTSHYPNSPLFTAMCDEYGFYVIDEADQESHGVGDLYGAGADFSMLAKDPAFKKAILDREERLVERDKNRPSVVIWSMGNESGFGENFRAGLAWTKKRDPGRLTHYESASMEDKDNCPDMDLYSRMYASVQEITDYFEKETHKKPFIQCEYIHAMGNGPGDAEDYAELIEKYDGFCGGFVWEWCDHAVYEGRALNGKEKYFYGGDFGEFPHDGNFCMDGLVYPDRTPHNGLKEYKNVIRPLRLKGFDRETMTASFKNMLDFTVTKDLLSVKWILSVNGKPACAGMLPDEELSIAPHQVKAVPIPCELPQEGTVDLRFVYLQKDGKPMTPAGHELGFDQVLVREEPFAPQAGVKGTTPKVTRDSRYITVENELFSYRYDTFTGAFDRMVYKNHLLTDRPALLNVWRAPTDNDRNVAQEWRDAGLDRLVQRAYETCVEKEGDAVVVKTSLSLTPVYFQRMANIQSAAVIAPDGSVTCTLAVEKNPDAPFFPRFGLRFFLPEEMDQAEYFGYGPYESYIDKHRASYLGLFAASAEEMHEDYLKPQENGSHFGCRYLKLSGGGASLTVTAKAPFSFSASPYTQEALTETRHSFELEKSGSTVLCLDYKQSGIGSNSCGPRLLEQYQLKETAFAFTLTLTPSAE